MHPVRARDCLHSDEDSRCEGRQQPDTQIRNEVVRGIRHPQCLRHGGRNRKNAGRSHSCWTVPAKFRTARHLLAYAADISERPIQVVHTSHFALQSSLHAKVTYRKTFVKT
jgi:hypothetical protein